MEQYLKLVKKILEEGEERKDRTKTGTLAIFGTQTKYDLRKGFLFSQLKKVLFDACLRELLWFLKGSTNINENLTQHTPIWNAWANEEGELGPVYGYQWRKWESFEKNSQGLYQKSHIDQITQLIKNIKQYPHSRRHIISAWNVADLPKMALPPCHLLFQFFVSDNKRLDCQLYQRSADIALGVPFNIASYSLLLLIIAQECNLKPGIFVHTIGDAHIYLNHIKGLKEQLTRKPKSLPLVKISNKPLKELVFEDFILENYNHYPFIKFPISV